MMRRLLTTALALSFAGGVYLAGAPAQASNMGFKLERDIDFVRDANQVQLRNNYWLSYPYFNGLGDLANTAALGGAITNACVGEPAGPATPDGIINVDDAMCDHWQARLTDPATAGTFSMTMFERSDCIPRSRTANIRFGNAVFVGDVFPLETEHGYQINMAAGAGQSPSNRVIIVGSHDPGFPGLDIVATPIFPSCNPGPGVVCCGANAAQRELIAVPYHSMYQRSVELLCGLEGTDWIDDGFEADGVTPAPGVNPAGDGKPDSVDECDTSIFDGVNTIAVSMFRNDTITNGPQTCTVSFRFGAINWGACPSNQDFTLVPGEAYLTNILATQTTTTRFLSPHF